MNKKITIIGLLMAGILMFGSCKPKQSAYKSVYESAKEKEVELAQAEESGAIAPRPTTGTKPTTYPTSNETVRKEKITPVYDTDASELKAYSIVIAAMGMKPNAESLKKRMQDEGYKIILVQNEEGLYRVIIGSYETKDVASGKKSEILARFTSLGDQATLRSKYGIPFDDWWILQRDF